MCKNEAHCIGATLRAAAPHVDSMVVYDTGSTDDTIAIVERFFEDTPHIKGEVIRAEWEGFATSKTKMMAAAKDRADYILHYDADDILLSFDRTQIDTSFDYFLATLVRGTSTWQASILYSGRLTWRFCGAAHTVIRCVEKPDVKLGTLPECRLSAEEVGVRAADPDKYLKDAKLLEQQWEATLVDDPDELHARSAFYAAQSYFDARRYADAMAWYLRYLEAPTWFEETFEAQLRIARCMVLLKHPPEAIDAAFARAAAVEPDRAEPHLYHGTWLNQNGRHVEAYAALKRAQQTSLAEVQTKYMLFVNQQAYGKWVNDELAVACYWTQRFDEGIELIKQIIDDEDFAGVRSRLISNLRFLEEGREKQPLIRVTRTTPRIVTVDGFFMDPHAVRHLALAQPFIESPDYHKGRRTADAFRPAEIQAEFERLLGRHITRWDYPANGVFQICKAGDQLVYHGDDQQYAAVVYLTPDAPLASGTAFFRDKATGARSLLDVPPPAFERGFYDASQFELVDRIGNVFNRCVIWDAKLIHAADGYFGNTDDNARLFQIFFFDAA